MTGWPRRARATIRPAESLGEETAHGIVHAVAEAVGTLIEGGYPPVILTTPAARAVLKDLTRADLPRLVVLSQREIPRDTPLEILGKVVEEEPQVVTTYATTRRWHEGQRRGRGEELDCRGLARVSEKAELMRSKTYRASTMKEAMTRVRRDLGGDAVILSAREVRRRRLFGLGARSVVVVTAERHDAG